MQPQVVFIDTVHPILQQRLENAGYQYIDATYFSKEQCIASIESAQGIVIRSRFRMDEMFLKNAKSLEFIARSGAGMENIDEAYC